MGRIKNRISITSYCLFLAALAGLTSCGSAPKDDAKISDAELIQKLPAESRSKIYQFVLRDFHRQKDPEIDRYLSGIANLITKNPVDAGVITAKNESQSNLVWALPPDRILFSDKLLKKLEFENEIAAAVAFYWELTREDAFQQRFLSEVDLAEPDLKAIYQFSEAEQLKAIETSVELLYGAQYDPRGLVTLFDKLKGMAASSSGEDLEKLGRLQEKARRTITYYRPLLNPVIRTQEFYRIQKRLERL